LAATSVRGGLIEPVRVDGGVWYFDFRQVSAASTICDLISRGVTPGAIRRQLKRLQGWLPDVEQPLAQLAAIEAGGVLLIRLAKGELAAGDGQLQLDFERGDDAESAPPTLKLVSGPTTASEWHELAIGQEQDGYLAEAVASYRDALLAGGPDVQIVFDLAHALQQLGRRDEAVERYRQAVEMAPAFVDAWNNLGVLLTEAELLEEACECFRRALAADPGNPMTRYSSSEVNISNAQLAALPDAHPRPVQQLRHQPGDALWWDRLQQSHDLLGRQHRRQPRGAGGAQKFELSQMIGRDSIL
jgi:tetratricopeptide (TPR) repeat protein